MRKNPAWVVPTLKDLDRLRRKVSLVKVIRQWVPLTKARKHYKGLCPFHQDTVPLFVVNQKRRIFHCFGCGVGGDIFGWTMRYHKLSFPEAVEQLPRMK